MPPRRLLRAALLCAVCQLAAALRPAVSTSGPRTVVRSDPDERTHSAWSREDDLALWQMRGQAHEIADALGRGEVGVRERLRKLDDDRSPASKRLDGAADEQQALRPSGDVIERLLHDRTLVASDFSFFYREAQEPLLSGAHVDATNDRIAGNARLLVGAIPQHRIAFVTFGKPARVVWHRGKRLDRVFGSGAAAANDDDGHGLFATDIRQVVDQHEEWTRARQAASKAAARDIRDFFVRAGAAAAGAAAAADVDGADNAGSAEADASDTGAPFAEFRSLLAQLTASTLTPQQWLAALAPYRGRDFDESLRALVSAATDNPALREAVLELMRGPADPAESPKPASQKKRTKQKTR